MRSLSRVLILFSGLLFGAPLFALSIHTVVEDAKKATGVQGNVGVIVSTTDNKVLYEEHADSYFIPASTTKTFLVAAILKTFPDDFTYKTKLYYESKGNVAHHIALHLSGDPSLTTDDLSRMLATLKARGIQSIEGPISLVDTAFSGPWYGPGWTVDSKHWYYAAPISGVMINKNSVAIKINNKIVGKTLQLQPAMTHDQAIKIKSRVNVVTDEAAGRCNIDVRANSRNEFKMTGCWAASEPRSRFEVAVEDPYLYFETQLRHVLAQQKIAFKGKVNKTRRSNKLPTEVIEHDSVSLSSLVNEILVNSDNIVAESLYKQLGLLMYKEGSFVKARLAIDHANKSMTASTADLALYDGSGQSRYSLVTPRQLNALLIECWNDPILAPRIIPHFAHSGQPGTLNSRLKEIPFKGKTGSMKGVRVLTGYLGSDNPWVITVMVDKSVSKDQAIPKLIDNVIRRLHAEYQQVS